MKWRQSRAAGSILTSSEKCRTVNYIYRQQQKSVRAPRILPLNSWLDVGLWRKLSNLLQGGVRTPNLYYCCHRCSKNLWRKECGRKREHLALAGGLCKLQNLFNNEIASVLLSPSLSTTSRTRPIVSLSGYLFWKELSVGQTHTCFRACILTHK